MMTDDGDEAAARYGACGMPGPMQSLLQAFPHLILTTPLFSFCREGGGRLGKFSDLP